MHINGYHKITIIGSILIVSFLFGACKKDKAIAEQTYNPTYYNINIPHGFPDFNMQPDNPLTIEGVALGRKLYYDPILDNQNIKSCSNCHLQQQAFTSTASVLPHINLAFNKNFLWDGYIEGYLEDIMLFEVEEFMQTDIGKLNIHDTYPQLFKQAFNVKEITSKEVSYALAQFISTLISGNSKYDRALRKEIFLSDEEVNGYEIFFTEKGDCFHCHGTVLFSDNLFHNNGLDSFPSEGRKGVTGDIHDLGKYKSPTLRNIEFTGPYMHDGRFETLEEVIDFYSEGINYSPTIDPLMKQVHNGGIQLSTQEKSELIAFLKTLSDTSFINNSNYSNPF